MMDDKRTVSSAHKRIDELSMSLLELSTIVKLQHKDLYGRIKLIQSIIIGASGAIMVMLATVLIQVI